MEQLPEKTKQRSARRILAPAVSAYTYPNKYFLRKHGSDKFRAYTMLTRIFYSTIVVRATNMSNPLSKVNNVQRGYSCVSVLSLRPYVSSFHLCFVQGNG